MNMEGFCLHGNGDDQILLEIKEVLGFPGSTSIDGGYDIICTLQIDAGCCHVKCDNLYSATGALYQFSNELRKCYQNLEGQADYRLLYEHDLEFTVAMTSNGHAEVSGTFRERLDKKNILQFTMETDQTCFMSVTQSIDELKKTYGDMQGIGK